MYLAGFTAELGDQLDRPDEIEIMLGGSRGRHLTHRIIAPTEVSVQKTDLGIDSAIQIKSADGTASIVHLA